jgi:hypothetical protein
VDSSPIDALLDAIDSLDLDRMIRLMAPDGTLLTADGSRAHGTDAVRKVFADYIRQLRATAHRVTAQWHVDGVWIAELEADYELRDFTELKALPRAMVLRDGPEGLADVRIYGAHEHPLSEHRTGEEGMWVGGRWIPPL